MLIMGACVSSPTDFEQRQLFKHMNTSNSGKVSYQEYLEFEFPRKYAGIQEVVNTEFFGYGTEHTRLLDYDSFLDIIAYCYPKSCTEEQPLDFNEVERKSHSLSLMEPAQDKELFDIRNIVQKMMDSSEQAKNESFMSISHSLGLNSRGMDLLFKNDAYERIDEQYITEHDMCILVDRLSEQGVSLIGLIPSHIRSEVEGDSENQVLSHLLLKEFDSTHSGSLSQIEFASLMMQIEKELEAHEQFLGAELHLVGPYMTGRTLGFGKTAIVKCAVNKDDMMAGKCEQICLKIAEQKSKKILATKKLFPQAEGYCTELQECEALNKCRFDYVVTMLNFFTHTDENKQNWDVLALELCGGGSLYEFRVSTQITEPIIRYFITELLITVENMHNIARIAHLDIRLENILIDKNGNAKLADFGTAVQFDTASDMLRAGTYAGTVTHMCPEMLEMENDYSASKSDMWECGLVLYELLTGKRAFELRNKSDEAVITKILRCDYEPLSFEFSKEARDLCESLLSFEPDDRPTASQALDHPWLQLPLHKPAIAKGIIAIDSQVSDGEVVLMLEQIFEQEEIEYEEVPLKDRLILSFKCTSLAQVVFTVEGEYLDSREVIDSFKMAQDAMETESGQRAIEDYLVNEFTVNDNPIKLTFYMRQGVLWEFERLFKRLRFLILTKARISDDNVLQTIGEVEEVVIRRSRSFIDEEGRTTSHGKHSFVLEGENSTNE